VTLTVAEIDRWSAEAVREVFHAANARGQATLEASRQLSSLAVFDTWEGATAEARKHTNASIRQDLDAHGNESLAVARAAGKAADDIERVQSELRTLRADASELHMTIDGLTNKVVPTSGCLPTEVLFGEMQLQPRLDKILAEANAVDAELAAAINMAEGNAPTPAGPHDNRPEIQQALSQPLPDDPKQFHDLWTQLTKEEKDWLYSQDHHIGNHPGMPWDPEDPQDPNNYQLGKDHYNQLHLPELQQNAQADVDRLQRQADALARQAYMGDSDAATQLSALAPQVAAAKHTLDGYKAVQADLNKNDGVKRYLGFIDDKGHAAVAINNPDTAKRNAIFVPGTGQDLAAFNGADAKSRDMYGAALHADPTLKAGDVAVTTWMGYDRPMDVFAARHPDPALAGAGALDSFESGNRASHVGPPSVDTVIGHSYGSTLVGAAASGGHQLAADNVIAVGSPGMLVNDVAGMNLDPGAKVYATLAAHDIIGPAGLVTQFTLGPEPVSPGFGATILAAAPGPTSDWGIDAHSSYWAPDNIALANMGAVIAGVDPPQTVNIKMSGQ
jgi:Alpha/beta hydrolase